MQEINTICFELKVRNIKSQTFEIPFQSEAVFKFILRRVGMKIVSPGLTNKPSSHNYQRYTKRNISSNISVR